MLEAFVTMSQKWQPLAYRTWETSVLLSDNYKTDLLLDSGRHVPPRDELLGGPIEE